MKVTFKHKNGREQIMDERYAKILQGLNRGTYLARDMHADREGPGDSNRIFIQGQIDQRTASQVAADAARKQIFAQAGDQDAAKQEVKASKAAKTLAESAGIDITKITGTGEGGAITKPDVQAYIAAKEQG